MGPEGVIKGTEFIAMGIEIMGVAVIAFSFVHAALRGLLHFWRRQADAHERLKIYIGKALQLGLEFLVAADILRTVSIGPTMESMMSLGLLIVVRTFLSWSITVEIEGCWPWQVAKNKKSEDRSQ